MCQSIGLCLYYEAFRDLSRDETGKKQKCFHFKYANHFVLARVFACCYSVGIPFLLKGLLCFARQ
jgi:hypothetical protein